MLYLYTTQLKNRGKKHERNIIICINKHLHIDQFGCYFLCNQWKQKPKTGHKNIDLSIQPVGKNTKRIEKQSLC